MSAVSKRIKQLVARGVDEDAAWDQAFAEQKKLFDRWEAENLADFMEGHPRFPRGSATTFTRRRCAENTAALRVMELDGLKPRKCPRTFVELDDEIAAYEARTGKKYSAANVDEWERRNKILRGELDDYDDLLDPQPKKAKKPKKPKGSQISRIVDAIDSLAGPQDWTKSGKPRVRSLEKILGFDITAAQRDSAHKAYKKG